MKTERKEKREGEKKYFFSLNQFPIFPNDETGENELKLEKRKLSGDGVMWSVVTVAVT